MTQHAKERRATKRLSVLWPARILSGAESQEGLCVDFSSAGASLCLEKPIQMGSRVGIQIELPSSEAVVASAEVVHLNSARGLHGLRFTEVRQTN